MYTIRDARKNRLYSIWVQFRQRCNNPRQKSYQDKNLSYDPLWDDYQLFMNWALCNGYSDDKSLEREDNSLGYNHINCKFATKQEQQYNRDKRDDSNFKSRYIGVSEVKPSKRMTSALKKPWRARVSRMGKEIYCECFATEIEAARGRDKYCLDNGINVVLNFHID